MFSMQMARQLFFLRQYSFLWLCVSAGWQSTTHKELLEVTRGASLSNMVCGGGEVDSPINLIKTHPYIIPSRFLRIKARLSHKSKIWILGENLGSIPC